MLKVDLGGNITNALAIDCVASFGSLPNYPDVKLSGFGIDQKKHNLLINRIKKLEAPKRTKPHNFQTVQSFIKADLGGNITNALVILPNYPDVKLSSFESDKNDLNLLINNIKGRFCYNQLSEKLKKKPI